MVDGTRAPIGVSLIGYGVAGSVLHGPLIEAEERLHLQAVACGRPERVHRDFPAVRVVATPAELLKDQDCSRSCDADRSSRPGTACAPTPAGPASPGRTAAPPPPIDPRAA